MLKFLRDTFISRVKTLNRRAAVPGSPSSTPVYPVHVSSTKLSLIISACRVAARHGSRPPLLPKSQIDTSQIDSID